MFLLLLIAVPVVEVLVFIEVALAIGWLLASVLLIATSVLGARLLRSQGRAALERVSLAVAERRAPGRAALDGALGFLGSALLVIPGFVTDALGALLLIPATRALARRWITLHYGGRVVSSLASAGRFASGGRGAAGRRAARPADVDSTAVDDDPELLDR
jgi:UPF0716 protein FxsA